MANAVLVDGLHLAQQMVQSFSLAPPSRSPAIILSPVCRDRASVTPMQPSLWSCPLPGTTVRAGRGQSPLLYSLSPHLKHSIQLQPQHRDVGLLEKGRRRTWGRQRMQHLCYGDR